MASVEEKKTARLRRHKRVRKQVFGTPERPRLAVFKSSKHVYAQLIDDTTGSTLVSASTTEPEIRKSLKTGGNIEAAKKIGQVIAERAAQKDIKKAVFDRGGFLYHGRVKAVADTAREKGLGF